MLYGLIFSQKKIASQGFSKICIDSVWVTNNYFTRKHQRVCIYWLRVFLFSQHIGRLESERKGSAHTLCLVAFHKTQWHQVKRSGASKDNILPNEQRCYLFWRAHTQPKAQSKARLWCTSECVLKCSHSCITSHLCAADFLRASWVSHPPPPPLLFANIAFLSWIHTMYSIYRANVAGAHSQRGNWQKSRHRI